MPEEAVLDAPIVDVAADSTVDTATPPETDIDSEPDTQSPEHKEASDAAALVQGDKGQPIVGKGNTLRADVKATLEELKVKDPKLAGEIRNALFENARLKSALPKGLAEVQQMRQTLESYGGAEKLQELKSTAEQFTSLDDQYTSGDPNFIENITNTDEGKAGFLQLAPSLVTKFSQLNPEGFASYFANVMLNDLRQNGVETQLQILSYLTRDNPQIKEVVDTVHSYLGALKDAAGKPMATKPAAQKQDTDPREQNLNQREQELTARDWQGSRETIRRSMADTEFGKATTGRKFTADDKAEIMDFFESKMRLQLKDAGSQHRQAIDGYFSSQNKAGYEKYFKMLYQQQIPNAMRYAVQKVLKGAPGPAAQARNGALAAPGTPAKAADGYTFIGKKPDNSEIVHLGRTREMIYSNQATLKDGRKVQWK